MPCPGGAGWATGRSGQCPKEPSVSFLGCRGLRFIQVFLQSICDGERDENHPNLIRVNATKAYEMALKKYHGWIVQKIFQVSRPRPRRITSLWGPFLAWPLLSCGPLEPASIPLGSGRAPLSMWGEAGALRGPLTSTCPAPSVAVEGVMLDSLWWSVEVTCPGPDWGAMGQTLVETLRPSG